MRPDTTPSGSVPDVVDDPRAVERVRAALHGDPEPVGLRSALELDAVLGRMERHLDELRTAVESALELPMSQLRVLQAVEDGAGTVRDVARATPLSRRAADVEVEQLRREGLLTVSEVSGDAPRLALSELGRTRLGQAEALRLRVLANLAEQADPSVLSAVARLTAAAHAQDDAAGDESPADGAGAG